MLVVAAGTGSWEDPDRGPLSLAHVELEQRARAPLSIDRQACSLASRLVIVLPSLLLFRPPSPSTSLSSIITERLLPCLAETFEEGATL